MGHTSNCPGLAEETSAKGNVVDTRALLVVPACYDDTSGECVLVLIADSLEDVSSHGDRGWVTELLPVGLHSVPAEEFQDERCT